MRCPNCGHEIEKAWNYCPGCGARFRRDLFSSIFNRIFSSMNRELKQMNHIMDKNIEALDISPYFIRPFKPSASAKGPNVQNRPQDRPSSARPRGSGFTISIRKSGSSRPRVSVRTFGNVDREKVREQLNKQMKALGLKRAVKETMPIAHPKPPSTERAGHFQEPPVEKPKSVEEPRTEVKRLGNSVIVNLEMPGVKSPDDIHVRELESSLEVRAKAGDKAYFKILTKPGRFMLKKKGFSSGILHLEFS